MEKKSEIRKEGGKEGERFVRRRGGGLRPHTRDALLSTWSYGELHAGDKAFEQYLN